MNCSKQNKLTLSQTKVVIKNPSILALRLTTQPKRKIRFRQDKRKYFSNRKG